MAAGVVALILEALKIYCKYSIPGRYNFAPIPQTITKAPTALCVYKLHFLRHLLFIQFVTILKQNKLLNEKQESNL